MPRRPRARLRIIFAALHRESTPRGVACMTRISARDSDDFSGESTRAGAGHRSRRQIDVGARLRAGLRRVALLCAHRLAGCAYHGDGPVEVHYQRYKAGMPEGDKVFVCSSYGCRTQTAIQVHRRRHRRSQEDHVGQAHRDARRRARGDEGRARLDGAPRRHGRRHRRRPAGRRLRRQRRPGPDGLRRRGDQPDELYARHGAPQALPPSQRRIDLRQGGHPARLDGWTHYAGILIENKSKQKFAVDGWLLASGKPPEIVEVEKWYIDDNDLLFGAKAPVATASARQSAQLAPPCGGRRPVNAGAFFLCSRRSRPTDRRHACSSPSSMR